MGRDTIRCDVTPVSNYGRNFATGVEFSRLSPERQALRTAERFSGRGLSIITFSVRREG